VENKGIPTLLSLLGANLHEKSLYELLWIIQSLAADCTPFKEDLIKGGVYELLRSLKLRETSSMQMQLRAAAYSALCSLQIAIVIV
jgi:hypothetical protein